MTHTFIVVYTAYNKDGNFVRSGTIKARNRYTELDAKIFAEDNLKRKYPSIHTLHITSCTKENIFNDLFGNFDSNPFRNF